MEQIGFLDLEQTSSRPNSDITGFHQDEREFAVVGAFDGVVFIDITNPSNPDIVGKISGNNSFWRDIKYWDRHVYIGTDGAGDGVNVISVDDPYNPTLVTTISDFTSSHNIYIDTEGYLYVVGAQDHDIWIYELTDHPDNPILTGIWDEEYLHDIEVFNNKIYGAAIYSGLFYIIDVNDKTNPTTLISHDTGGGFISTHDCAVTNDENYLITGDETRGGHIKIWDIADYNNINMVSEYMTHPDHSIHNVYVHPEETNLLIMSYYVDGTRVVDIEDPLNPVEVGFYDTSNLIGLYDGNWGTYADLPSGHIISSDRQTGLYIFSSALVEGSSLEWNPCGNNVSSDQSYNQNDINVLQDIIDANNLDINDPTALGTQSWEDDRLIYLNLFSGYTSETSTVQLTTLPESIANLNSLKQLILTNNKLTSLPICTLLPDDCFIDVDENHLCEEDLLCNKIGSSINQDCNPYPDCYTGFTGVDNYCYHQSDLDVLQEFIDNSSKTINMDLDLDSSGVIEPLELGEQIWKLGRLTSLELNNSGLSGVIPAEIGTLTNLIILSLFSNQLSGVIPESIGDLTNLTMLYLHSNQLSGIIPESIGNLVNLNLLFLQDNQLSGTIPNSICNIYTSMNYFSIYSNQLCPPYPECIFQGEDYSDDNGNGIWDEGEAFIDSNENDMYEEGNIGYQEAINCLDDCNGVPGGNAVEDNCGTCDNDPGNDCAMSILETILPSTYVLFEPYPNPFNPATIIEYSLPYTSNIKLTIYDLLGRQVEILYNGKQHPGNYTIKWDGGKYSSSIYLVQMTIKDIQNNDKSHFLQTRKMVFLK